MRILFQFKQMSGPRGPVMVLFTKDPEWRPATSDEANTFLQSKVQLVERRSDEAR